MREALKNIFIRSANYFVRPKKSLFFLYGHAAYKNAPDGSFNTLLRSLSEYVEFINFEEAVMLLENNTTNGFTKPKVCFSFDDGFEECYTDIYPALMSYGVNACFFINSNFIEGDDQYKQNFKDKIVRSDKNPMTKEMILEMSKNGFLFGNHTQNHANLASLDSNEQEKEIYHCKEWLESLLGKECLYFAWPYGKDSDVTKAAINIALTYHKYIFSANRSDSYYSFGGQAINRDHFEGFWPSQYVRYFLSLDKQHM
ncbi:MAG: polysaccharide deacetylase family protein [Pseudomonadota bacterium]|nr:polysaccharide deacetylase family protein [Pseudomonadota bacterium]